MPNTGHEGALKVAQSIVRELASLAIEHSANRTGSVTISIGIATVEDPMGLTPDALLKAADTALYEAKHLGRNQIRCSIS